MLRIITLPITTWLLLGWLWGCWGVAQGDVQDALTRGLVAYYPFSGDARDASGAGNDGMVNGAALTTDRFGNPDSAYYFDGEDDNIVVQNSPSLNMAVNHQITISAWVQPEDLESDRFSHVVRKASGRSGAGFLFAFQNRGRELSLGINNSAGQESNTAIDPSYFADGAWHFIAGTFDGRAFRIYIDGRLVATELLSQRINPNGEDPMFIGSYWRGQFFQGGIDDLRLYNRALTTSELEQLYQQERLDSGQTLPVDVPEVPAGDARVLPPPPLPSEQPAPPPLDASPSTPAADPTENVSDDITDAPVLVPPPMPAPVPTPPVTTEPPVTTDMPTDVPADEDVPTEISVETLPADVSPADIPPVDMPIDDVAADDIAADVADDVADIILPSALQPEDDSVCRTQVANYFVDSRRLVIPALYVELLDALSREPTGQFATFAVTLSHEPEGRTFSIVMSSVSLVPEDDVEIACRAQYDGERIEIPLLEADAYIESLPGVRLPAPRQRLELTLRQHGDDLQAFRVESFELR